VCLSSQQQSRDLATELRTYGLRARTFVSLDVLRAAAANQPPAAVILETPPGGAPPQMQTMGGDAHARPLAIAVSAEDGFHVRLAATEAGADAFLPLPLNLVALLDLLHNGSSPPTGLTGRVAVIAESESDINRLAPSMAERGIELKPFSPGEELLSRLERFRADAIVVDADANSVAPALLVKVLRQVPTLATPALLVATNGDKRELDRSVGLLGIDGLVGLPVEAADLTAILLARIRRAAGLRRSYDYLAKRDPRTGLYSRDYLVETLGHVQAAATAGTNALVYIEVEPGDGCDSSAEFEALMVTVAQTLRRRLPAFAVPARLGSDAIGVLLTAPDEPTLHGWLNTLRDRLASQSLVHRGRNVAGRALLGMALLDGQRFTTADGALAAAREQATSGAAAAENQPGQLTDFWAARVQDALDTNRFRLVYQPISSISGHPSAFFEVFVRMVGQDGTEVAPAEFLPAARSAGLGPALDRWIIGRAIHVLGQQGGAGSEAPRFFLKVFPETIGQNGFATWLARSLTQEAVSADRLVVELPHAAVAAKRSEADAFMKRLTDIGCAIAIEHYDHALDDGETLARGGFRYLKLRHTLTNNVLGDRAQAKAVAHVASEARQKGVNTIACLVQDAANLSGLWQAGVEYIQGNFMHEPEDVFASASSAEC
jgi:EAL domain-containing protein (putative c-di-GMP-specific phosphodiesterase class I)/GGDEF domain-containing protein